MRKALFLALGIVALLGLSMAASAQNFSVSLTPEDNAVRPVEGVEERTATFELSITNHFPKQKRFLVSVESVYPDWSVPGVHGIEPNETRTVSLTITIPHDKSLQAGRRGFFVTVFPEGQTGSKQREQGTLFVERAHDLALVSFQTDRFQYRPGDTITATAGVKAVRGQPLRNYTLHFSAAGTTSKLSLPTVQPGSSVTLTKHLPLGQYIVGSQNVRVVARDADGNVVDSSSVQIDVAAVRNVERDTEEENAILWKTFAEEVHNTGNIVVENETITASISSIASWVTLPDPEPDVVRSAGGETQYIWKVDSLAPGARFRATYRINYWIVYVLLGLILGFGLLFYHYLTAVSVNKQVIFEEGETRVHIHVHNASQHALENVRLNDRIPGIASLIEEFPTGEPDAIRKTEQGAELSWKLGTLAAGEERIFTYTIRPRIQVEGSVSLPSAHLSYERKGETYEELSNAPETRFT